MDDTHISRAVNREVNGTFFVMSTELFMGVFIQDSVDNEFVGCGENRVAVNEKPLFLGEFFPLFLRSAQKPIDLNVKIICNEPKCGHVWSGFIEIAAHGADGKIQFPSKISFGHTLPVNEDLEICAECRPINVEVFIPFVFASCHINSLLSAVRY